jgi:hypothetical protein
MAGASRGVDVDPGDMLQKLEKVVYRTCRGYVYALWSRFPGVGRRLFWRVPHREA